MTSEHTPDGQAGRITHVELVGAMRIFERGDIHPDDDAAVLIQRNRKYLADGQDQQLACERGRLIVAGLADYHLDRRRWNDLHQFLTSYSYLAARVAYFGIGALLADFRRFIQAAPKAPYVEMQLLFDVLTLSQPILKIAPSQLPEQLLARLPADGSPRIEQLRRSARRFKQPSVWLQPITTSFTGPGAGVRRIIEEHRALPTAVAFSADGCLLVSADEKRILVRDMSAFEVLTTLEGHCADVTDLIVSSDNRWIVAAVRDPIIFCWPLRGGAPIRLKRHRGVVHTLLALPGGRMLSGGSDGAILVWDLNAATCHQLGCLDAPVSSLAGFSTAPNVISASGWPIAGRGVLTIWDLYQRRSIRTFPWSEPIDAVAVSGDDRCVLAAANKTLLRWQWPGWDGPVVLGHHDWKISRIVSSRDGDWAVTADTGGDLRVLDLRRSAAPQTLKGHRTLALGLALNHAGILASAGHDGTVRLWDFPPPSKSCPRNPYPFGHESAITCVQTCAYHGRQLAISASRDHTLAIWDVSGPQRVSEAMSHEASVNSVVAMPERGLCVSVGWDGYIRIWNLGDGRQLRNIQSPDENLQALAVDAKAMRAITASFEGRLRLWDLARGDELGSLDAGIGSITCLAFLSDGRSALAGGRGWALIELSDNPPRLIGHSRPQVRDDVGQHGIAKHPSGATPSVNAIRLFPDASRSLLATAAGQLLLADPRDGQVEATWQDGPCGIADAAISPCGRWLASVGSMPLSSSDDTLRIWDCQTGQVIARFIGDCPLTCCAVLANPDRVIVGDQWGRLHLFGIERG